MSNRKFSRNDSSDTVSLTESNAQNLEQLYDDEGNDLNSTVLELDTAMEKIGVGAFHYKMLIILGVAVSSDSVELVSVSFILPLLTCDLQVSSEQKGWLNSLVFLGMMLGGIMWGALSDVWGRRLTLCMCLFVNGFAAFISVFSPTFYLLMICRFLSGIGVGGSYPILFSYISELLPPSRRQRYIAILSSLWLFAGLATACLAWLMLPSVSWPLFGFTVSMWRPFIVVCSLPALISVVTVAILPETPKYLMMRRRVRSALQVVNRIAIKNGLAAPNEQFISGLRIPEDAVLKAADSEMRSNRLGRFLASFVEAGIAVRQLCGTKYRFAFFALLILTFTLSFGYYGILFWLPEMFHRMEQSGGSTCAFYNASETLPAPSENCTLETLGSTQPYFDALLTNLATLPGAAVSVLLINRLGSKTLLIVSMLLTGFSVGGIAFLVTRTDILIMTCLFSALSISGWNSLAVKQVEAFPTNLRATGVGILQALGRLGSMASNIAFGYLVDAKCYVPIILASGSLVFGGLSAFMLPKPHRSSLY